MKTIYLRLCLIGLLLCSVLTNTAQTPEWINLHKGNSAFKAGDMSTAEKAYRQALKANPHSARAAFNLGDVYLNKKDAQNALKFYEQAAKQEKSKLVRAMGYIHHVAKEYDRAINYYKDALRNNPKDDDTRYNLVLCQKQKKQEDQQKQNENKNDKQSNKEKNEQQDKQQTPQNERKEQNKQPNSGISKENAEQLLNLSRQNEQQTRRKVENAQQPRVKQLDKNW